MSSQHYFLFGLMSFRLVDHLFLYGHWCEYLTLNVNKKDMIVLFLAIFDSCCNCMKNSAGQVAFYIHFQNTVNITDCMWW